MGDTQTIVAGRRPPLLWYGTTAASIAIGLVPIWILETWFGVPRKIIVGYGILAFVLGTTAVKLPLHHFLVERVLRPRLTHPVLALAHGLVSGISELGAAAVFFIFVTPQLSLWQLVGFGVGAGAAEAIMLPFISNPFKGTSLGDHAGEVFAASAGDRAIQWLSVVERIWAMLLQVSTRGLVYLSVAGGSPVPVLAGLAGFAAVDGVVYYWHLTRVRFDSVPVLLRVHAFLAVLAAALTLTFVRAVQVAP